MIITNLEQIIGQTFAKTILVNKMKNDKDIGLLILMGSSGSGKSTMAHWYALAKACPNGTVNPCCDCEICRANIGGLDSPTGVGYNIKRINLAEVDKSIDEDKLIEDVFNLQQRDGGMWYIFEEIQERPKIQGKLLEKTDHIPENVHIVITTTDEGCLYDQLLGRADIALRFKPLMGNEALMLIDKICFEEEIISLSANDKKFLARATHNNAREITKFLKNLGDMEPISSIMREYYDRVNSEYYLKILEALFKDFSSFIKSVDKVEQSVNIINLWKGMSEFIRDCIYLVDAGVSDMPFTKDEIVEISKIFSQLTGTQKQKMWKVSHKYAKDKETVEMLLATMREIFNEPLTIQNSKVRAVEEKLESEKAFEQREMERPTNEEIIKPKKLSLSDLANASNNKGRYMKSQVPE